MLWSRYSLPPVFVLFFFFNDTATTEIYTLSLHDALPISDERLHRDLVPVRRPVPDTGREGRVRSRRVRAPRDRKSTRLNSSHLVISYAVFCLKKKKNHHIAHALLLLLLNESAVCLLHAQE